MLEWKIHVGSTEKDDKKFTNQKSKTDVARSPGVRFFSGFIFVVFSIFPKFLTFFFMFPE